MRFAIWMPILMRTGSALVFVLAAIVAGAANRSLLIVPALAALATLANLNTPRMMLNLTGAPQQGIIARAMTIFFTRTLLFAIVFGFSVLVAALFRVTDLARDFTNFDIGLLVVPFGLALFMTAMAQRSPLGNPEELMADIQKAFADLQANNGAPPSSDDTFTVDCEFEERKPDDS